MPPFDGLGLTAAQQALAMVVFVVVLSSLYAWSLWKGSREKDNPTVTKNYAFSGQLADMEPVRQLVVAVTDLLEPISEIAATLKEDAERRQRDRDADEAAIRRELREPKPRRTPVSRGQS